MSTAHFFSDFNVSEQSLSEADTLRLCVGGLISTQADASMQMIFNRLSQLASRNFLSSLIV